jgi:hypothetical protein
MPTHVKRNSFLALALMVSWQGAMAQTGNFGNPSPAPAPAPTGNGTAPAPASAPAPGAPAAAPSDGTEIDSSTSQAIKSFMTQKPTEGSAGKATAELASALADKIKAMDSLKTPGLDTPEMRARFETYLSLKEVPDPRIKEYFGKMAQISDMLKQGDTFGAWKLLYSLSQYQDLDAGISRELASRVEAFWNTDRTKNGLEMANDKLRDNIDTYNHNADMDADDIAQEQAMDPTKAAPPGKGGGSGGGSSNSGGVSGADATNSPLNSPTADPVAAEAALMPTMSSALQGKLEMTSEYLNLLEARAKIKLNEIRENKMSDQDRMDFSDYIKTLYDNHRYYHVIIAADFYRALFNEGDYPADLSNQAVAAAGSNGRAAADAAHLTVKSLGVNASGPIGALNNAGAQAPGAGDDNQPMSIADEVTSALEINNRVSEAIEVFKFKASQGDIAAAADELQQAFVGNEFHPALQGLARDDKQKVGDFLDKLDVLKNQLEVRDFEQVEGQVAAIQKIAVDFDATKPLAMVNGIKLESRLRLGKARLLAQGGDLNDAMLEFQTAAEEWPGNPDLNTSANTFFKTENNQDQATTDFDRMVQDQDYRGIFGRQLEFALAVKGDSTREQQLKDALEKVQKAEVASEKANMLVMNGDVDGAWETIQLAAKEWPDDMKLNKLLASLSERSADFVSDLDKAQDAEAKKEYGYSLTWYVNAQSVYPPSVIANEGIDRLTKLILSPAADGTSSSASAN